MDAFQRQGDVAGAMEARELEVTLAADAGDHARARGLAPSGAVGAQRRAPAPRVHRARGAGGAGRAPARLAGGARHRGTPRGPGCGGTQ